MFKCRRSLSRHVAQFHGHLLTRDEVASTAKCAKAIANVDVLAASSTTETGGYSTLAQVPTQYNLSNDGQVSRRATSARDGMHKVSKGKWKCDRCPFVVRRPPCARP